MWVCVGVWVGVGGCVHACVSLCDFVACLSVSPLLAWHIGDPCQGVPYPG